MTAAGNVHRLRTACCPSGWPARNPRPSRWRRGRRRSGWRARRSPAAGPGRADPTMRAGFSLITRATSRHVSRPGRTIVSTTTDSAVCRPSMPGRALANSHIFSCSACGAWSVATQSITPSASAWRSASASDGLAQRRVDPVAAVVGGQPAVVEQQVVRRHLGGDRNALLLGPSDDLDGAGGGGVADVHPGPGVAGQQRVAGDDGLLGGAGPAGQAQPGGVRALRARRRRRSAAAPRRAGRSARPSRSRTRGRGA